MNKVKITVEQEKALNIYKKNVYEERRVHAFINYRNNWDCEYKTLKELDLMTFSLLLHGWYEVEQPFKVGDWHEYTKENGKVEYIQIEEIVNDDENGYVRIEFTDGEWLSDEELNEFSEKVEEPYKILLLELGREKPVFKSGDVYRMDNGTMWRLIDENDRDVVKNFKSGKVTHLYPVESRIEVKANV